MKKINFLISILFFVSFIAIPSSANAQTYILDEVLTEQTSFDTFTAVSITGDQNWYFDARYGAVMNGYSSGSSYQNEDWFISPAMDLSGYTNLKLTFDHTRGNAAVMNVGVTEGWYKVFATASYTGNMATTVWTEIAGVNHSLNDAWVYISSGELAIPASVKSATTRIAFKYVCDNTQSATWEIKNVKVFGTATPVTPDGSVDFKITTWNVEWLSCDQFGPSDEDAQMNNVVKVIKEMNSDIVALQEVGTSSTYATIDTLVRRLGSDWGGNIIPNTNSNCGQNQGIVYKKSKVQFTNSELMSSGNSWSNGNFSGTYSYNWAGRYPALYNVKLVAGSELIPVSLVNIHAKASNDETSYNRRTGASVGLKNILDGSAYNTKRVVFLGDFNDYLEGTQCGDCGGLSGTSPYKNFMDDTENYKGLTGHLINTNYANPVIDNFIISNELFDNYLINSAILENSATQVIPNYGSSNTSGHTPVSITLRVASGGGSNIAVTGVSLNKTSTTLDIGGTEQLTATVAPDSATNKNVSWNSNNTGVATVSSSGLVTAVAAGEAVISATTVSGNHVARCTVTVNVMAVNGVSLNKTSTTLDIGGTEQLIATVTPSNATNKNVSWNSNSTGVATVNNSGLVTAVAAGTAVISATTADGGYVARCTVSVSSSIVVTGISLSKTSTTLLIGGLEMLTATVVPSNATNKSVTWSSNNTSVATVSNGLVKAVSVGTAVISATTVSGNHVARCTVIVNSPITGVESDNINGLLKVYPNPVADGELRIEGGELIKGDAVEIYNLNGALVLSQELKGEVGSINVSRLPNGTYLLKLGKYTTKFVKQVR